MAEEAVLSVRAMIFGAEVDLLKGLIVEHSIDVDDLEALTKLQAVTLVDNWFLTQLKDKEGGLMAIHSLMETLEKKPTLTSVTVDSDGASKVSPFRKEFKIAGQIDCRMGISYMSLRRQIENGKEKGYKEIDIIDAVIKAIPPTSGLRHYLEGKEKLSLGSCIQILRAHYNEKSATELYNQLGQMTQNTKETSAEFLMRALELRQKVVYASKESSEDMKYSNELVHSLFIRTVITGLSNNTVKQEFKPILEQKGIEDEELIESLNKIVSRETERQSKFGKRVNEVKVDEGKSDNAGMQAIKAEISELRLAVEQLAFVKSSESDKTKTNKRCQQCEDNNRNKCLHCWKCGSEEHWSRGCRKLAVKAKEQGNANRSHQGGKV